MRAEREQRLKGGREARSLYNQPCLISSCHLNPAVMKHFNENKLDLFGFFPRYFSVPSVV
jgi:hypothetical protein